MMTTRGRVPGRNDGREQRATEMIRWVSERYEKVYREVGTRRILAQSVRLRMPRPSTPRPPSRIAATVVTAMTSAVLGTARRPPAPQSGPHFQPGEKQCQHCDKRRGRLRNATTVVVEAQQEEQWNATSLMKGDQIDNTVAGRCTLFEMQWRGAGIPKTKQSMGRMGRAQQKCRLVIRAVQQALVKPP